MIPASEPGVAHVERLDGAAADPQAPPALLVEVPHGADRRAHFDALRARLVGDLPDDLLAFFCVNTDVGAWQLGRAVAARFVAARPRASALLVRCLIPRTFIDCNRVIEAPRVPLSEGGMTPGLPPYVRHPRDRALLLALHERYVALAGRAFEAVCGAGGLALIPHTYAPRSVQIGEIGDDIGAQLRRAWAPEQAGQWPLRAQVDLLTRTGEGTLLAPEGALEALVPAYAALGLQAVEGHTYFLHPATQGYAFAARYPGRTLSLEVRRDLLVEAWEPFEEMRVDEAAAARVAGPLAALFGDLAG